MREIKTKYGPGRIATSADKSHIVHRPVTKSSILSSEENPSVELDIKTSGHGFPPRATRRASPPPWDRAAGRPSSSARGHGTTAGVIPFWHRWHICPTGHNLGELP